MPNIGQDEAGFVSLFDGQTLQSWVVVKEVAAWSVQDGMITCDGTGRGCLQTTRHDRRL